MKGIAKISVKILSIYFFVEFITQGIPQIFGIFKMRQEIGEGLVIGIIISQLLKLLIAVYLWYFAEKLSIRIMGNIKNESIKEINYRKLQLIAFSVVGIVLLATSIPEIAQYIVEYLSMSGRVITNILPKLIAKTIELIIGIWLLLGLPGVLNKISN